jgi:hypothetical protein
LALRKYKSLSGKKKKKATEFNGERERKRRN